MRKLSNNKFQVQDISFKDILVDSYSGQSNMKLDAEINGEVTGSIFYTIFGDEIAVSLISVDEKHRRKGVGTLLLKKLQSIYPETEIQMGYLTEDGSKLWRSVDKTVNINERYKELELEKQLLKDKESKLNDWFEKVYSEEIKNPDRSTVLSNGDKLNSISDRIYEIEEELRNMRPNTTFVKY